MLIDPLSRRFMLNIGQNGLIVLMYHAIEDNNIKPTWPYAVSLQQFKNQLDLLNDQNWTTIGSDSLSSGITNLPDKAVLITFDDGYANNFIAFQELAKRNMKASWFVATRDIGQMSSWIDDNTPSYPLLAASQLSEMHAAGMEIGSHTHSHSRLTQLGAEQIDRELRESKTAIETLLNTPVISLAYPYGQYNASVVSAARSAGYRIAFTTHSGFGLVNDDLMQVRRISIMAGDSLSIFARKLAFADNDVSWPHLGAYVYERLKDRMKTL
ncbi:polysaccharide deacetylase family protein [Methylomonas sp. LL1]|uniref:polysaccharide deacetylase family protein n=1 Tax=Methylomonas sp. LL1 TaxID=2785785 RepID=UPI0018C372F4|nr:polysaccharide deacetylase family protein [Methylomonas sp. LL1]QPK65315.1 polysaccharide deacetylase family protein [Methylomonas sp. LL1]